MDRPVLFPPRLTIGKKNQLVEMAASNALGNPTIPSQPEQQWFRRHKKSHRGGGLNHLNERDAKSSLAKKRRDLDTERSAGREDLPPNPFQRERAFMPSLTPYSPKTKQK